MSALRAPRARARSAPSHKLGSNTPKAQFWVFWADFGPKTRRVPLMLALFLCNFQRGMNILRSNRRKCGSGRRLVEGVDMRKSQKSPSLPSLAQRVTHLYMFLSEIIAMPQKCPFFSKGPLRGTMSSVITSRARGLSVLRRKNGFEPRFGAFLAREQHSIGRLIAPQCESHSPHDAASGYHWSKRHSLGGVNTPRTPPSLHMKAGMQK